MIISSLDYAIVGLYLVGTVIWLLEGEDILHLDLEARSSGPGSGPLSRRHLQFAFFLPNLQLSLFAR